MPHALDHQIGENPRVNNVATEAGALRGWLFERALPLWWEVGANRHRGGFPMLVCVVADRGMISAETITAAAAPPARP